MTTTNTMSATYDPSVDAFYLRLAPAAKVARTVEWGPGVHLDMDTKGRLLGIEVLDASTRFSASSLGAFGRPTHPLTLAQAAAESGLAIGTLKVQIGKGRLIATKRGRDWIVERADLLTYLESRAPSGRPAAHTKGRRGRSARKRSKAARSRNGTGASA